MEKQIKEQLAGKKILFASAAADGHFNPLTGLAKYLQEAGCDVRWFTSDIFAEKLKKLNIPLYPYNKTVDLMREYPDLDNYKGRGQITDPIEKLNFDFINIFINRSPEYYADILDIYEDFPFDLMIAESVFTVIPFVRAKMNIPVLSIGIVPLAEKSVDLGPYGMALPPATSNETHAEYAKLNDLAVNVLFKQSVDIYDGILNEHGIEHERSLFPDLLIKHASLYLQIGTPGFEYQRSDIGSNVRFIGALLPYQAETQKQAPWFDERVNQYKKIVLVTQGTVEKDTAKLTEPTLEAFKDTDVLVIATTAGSNTVELQKKYSTSKNIIIEDYIPFNEVMPYASVYVTNGGYGGTLLSVSNKLPMVAAGVHEGKSEICARIGHFNYGINLNTEVPEPEAIRNAAEEVMSNEVYKNNVIRLNHEMSTYNSLDLCVSYALELLNAEVVANTNE
ncbi:MAG: glycosyltransferase [Mucilaginibacter sp.]|uniref:glycosyltransferase n=1 Tax=Mucilaginibacter sp. TaxID=1882438 RepID=UPI0031B3B6F3